MIAASALALCHLIVLRLVFRLPVPVLAGRQGLAAARRAVMESRRERRDAGGVQSYTGTIVLGFLSMPDETAWHSASLRLFLAVHTGVWLYHATLLPNLSRLVRDEPREMAARNGRVDCA